MLTHRSWSLPTWTQLYPLASRWLARAASVSGDQVKARRAYKDLFA